MHQTLTLTDGATYEAVFVLVLYANGAEANRMAFPGQSLAVLLRVLVSEGNVGLPAPGKVVFTATEYLVDLERHYQTSRKSDHNDKGKLSANLKVTTHQRVSSGRAGQRASRWRARLE